MRLILTSLAAVSATALCLVSPCPAQIPPGMVQDANIQQNITYLPESRKEKADLYLPIQDGKKHPGMVIIHGGGWVGGTKDATREVNIGRTLANHGYVCLSIDYQLDDSASPTLCWPQNLQDCKTAVRWLRANADALNLDADHIGVIGGSTGGHLACMVGVTGSESGLDPSGPYADKSCRVNCVVAMYAPVDLVDWKDIAALRTTRAAAPELYKQFSVLTHLDPKDPPVLILQGDADTLVDVDHSKRFAQALAQQGIEHRLEIIPGAGHTFHLQPPQKDLRPLVVEFLNKHLKGP